MKHQELTVHGQPGKNLAAKKEGDVPVLITWSAYTISKEWHVMLNGIAIIAD